MTEIKIQLILFWISVGFCFVGTILLWISLIFKRESLLKFGVWAGFAALVPMTAALILRWRQTGHIPYVGSYEAYTSIAWSILLFYIIVLLLKPPLKITGIVAIPLAMLFTGLGILGSTELTEVSKNYFYFWLFIHILFAKAAIGSLVVSAALGLIYLIADRRKPDQGDFLVTGFPSLERIDYLSYRFAAFGFVMLGIMIIAGSLWAYKMWNRYWGWDPVETWSLISWLIYGVYLHLRVMGVKGKTASWLGLTALVLVLFTFFGTPYLYSTAHEYLKFIR